MGGPTSEKVEQEVAEENLLEAGLVLRTGKTYELTVQPLLWSVEIDVPVNPDAPESHDDRFTLRGDDGSYEQTKTVKGSRTSSRRSAGGCSASSTASAGSRRRATAGTRGAGRRGRR